MLTSDRIVSRPAKSAAKEPLPTRIEELSTKIVELRAQAEELSQLKSTTRRIKVRFGNNPEAAGLEKRLELVVDEIYSEAGRLDAIMALEPVTSEKDALLLLLNTSWRLANADEESTTVIENVFRNLILFHERGVGAMSEDLGFAPVDALRPGREVLLDKISSWERLTNLAEADIEKQTIDDLRMRLTGIFEAHKADDEEAYGPAEEFILALQSDDPNVIAAKLIITLSGEIIRNAESQVRDERRQAEAALSALRHFELETLYRECFRGDGAKEEVA